MADRRCPRCDDRVAAGHTFDFSGMQVGGQRPAVAEDRLMASRGEATSLRPDQEAMLERARVVQVLDGWCGRHARAIWQIELNADGAECVGRVDEGARGVRQYFRKAAHTVDAARAAAAKAIESGEV